MARLRPQSAPIPNTYDCLEWFMEVWPKPALHEAAAKGYWSTGCSNKLDGSEDHLICREAGAFWSSFSVSARRARDIVEVETEHTAGSLKWNYKDVYGVVLPFPKRGCLDETLEFQDNEIVAELGEKPYLEDGQ